MERELTAIRLTSALEKRKMLPAELAKKSGVSKASISQYMNGLYSPSKSTSEKLAKVLYVNPLWLMGYDVPRDAIKVGTYSKSPIYEAAAGEGRTTEWYSSDEISLQLPEDSFIATVKGRSMEPTLLDGDKVVIAQQSVLDFPRQIALVKINGDEATLKRVEIKDNGILLIADNIVVYPPHFYTAEEVDSLPVNIEGVVVQLIRNLR